MSSMDNPFAILEDDDEGVDPITLLARVEAKKISSNATVDEKVKRDGGHKFPTKPLPPADAVRAEKGRGGGRGGGHSWAQYGDGYSRGFRGDYNGLVGHGARGGGGGRGGRSRGRGRGFYENQSYGENGNQVRGSGDGLEESGQVQGRGYYETNGNRGYWSENRKFGDMNRNSGWEGRGYGGEGRWSGGWNGRYRKIEGVVYVKKENAGEGKENNGSNADGRSGRDILKTIKVPKEAKNEQTNPEQLVSDVSEKKTAEEENTMTLEEYEKLLFEKRKALEGLKTQERKVLVDKDLENLEPIQKKKDDSLFVKLMSEKDKLKKKDSLEKEEKARKSLSINEFLKPAEGEMYMGPSYARERAARIRAEQRARAAAEEEQRATSAAEKGKPARAAAEEEQTHAAAEEGPDAPAASTNGGLSRGRGHGRVGRGGYREDFSGPQSASEEGPDAPAPKFNGGGRRGPGRGRGERGGYRGDFSGPRAAAEGGTDAPGLSGIGRERGGLRGGSSRLLVPPNDSADLEREFPVLGVAVKH